MSKEWNEVEVCLPAVPGKESRVVLNGVLLKDVKAVSLKSCAEEVTEVTITLIASVNRRPVADAPPRPNPPRDIIKGGY